MDQDGRVWRAYMMDERAADLYVGDFMRVKLS
jgi:hypothetical protein